MRSFAMLLLCTACGVEPILMDGSYDVEETFTRDDITGDANVTGQTLKMVWNIQEVGDGNYSLDMVNSTQDIAGKESGREIAFEMEDTEIDYGCKNGQLFYMDITPSAERDSFVGSFVVAISVGNIAPGCDEINWLVFEATVKGTLR